MASPKIETALAGRLNQLIDSKVFKNKNAMAKESSLNPMTICNALDGADARFSTLESILKANVRISAEWLMRGEGGMFRSVAKMARSR